MSKIFPSLRGAFAPRQSGPALFPDRFVMCGAPGMPAPRGKRQAQFAPAVSGLLLCAFHFVLRFVLP